MRCLPSVAKGQLLAVRGPPTVPNTDLIQLKEGKATLDCNLRVVRHTCVVLCQLFSASCVATHTAKSNKHQPCHNSSHGGDVTMNQRMTASGAVTHRSRCNDNCEYRGHGVSAAACAAFSRFSLHVSRESRCVIFVSALSQACGLLCWPRGMRFEVISCMRH